MENSPLYRPLHAERKEIRLLLVKAGEGDQPLVGELQHASLESADRPQYETISYCWGDATKTATVILNDKETTVPLSSMIVLRRVRQSTQDRLVWIDALCINQCDVDERGQQVALMEDIYSSTVQNLIWLGHGDEKVINYMLFVLGITFEHAMHMTNNGKHFYEVAIETKPSEGLGVPIIVQEAILPPKSLVYVGSHEIPFQKLLLSATWLFSIRELMSLRPLNKYIGLMNCMNIYKLSRGKDASLADFLQGFLTFKATNPRDYVYGVLGLWKRNMGYKGALSTLLQPDYNKSVIEVMRDASRFIIQESPRLDYLRFICHRKETDYDDTRIPSWVEPWHLRESKFHLAADLREGLYSADNGVPMQLTETSEPNILSLTGIIVGTVGRVTPPIMDDKLLIGSLEQPVSPLYIQNLKDDPERLGRAMIAEANELGERPTPEFARLCIKWAEYCIQNKTRPIRENNTRLFQNHYTLNACFRLIHKITNSEKGNGEEMLDEDEEREEEDWNALVNYDKCILTAAHFRRYFELNEVDTKGANGLGPAYMLSYDVVAILYGCSWPVVLRPRGELYKFIGVCYFPGIMDGEAVQKHIESGAEDVVFKIQ